jgi:hypothetical protein
MLAMADTDERHEYDPQCPCPACRARATRDEPTYRALVSVGRLLRGDFARAVLARADVEGLCGELREYRGWLRSSFVVEVRGEAEALTRFARWFEVYCRE